MKKIKLVRNGVLGVMLVSSLAGCAKKVDCPILGEHVHLYDNGSIVRYIESDYEKVGSFSWTPESEKLTKEMKIVCDNQLCLAEDNVDYLLNKEASVVPYREEYSYEYIYGTFYGYDYGYNVSTGEYGYGYGLKLGYHWEYVWQNIPIDRYTTNKVRDITYKIRLYKITETGEVVFKDFNSLDEVENGYIYFKNGDFIKKYVSDSYYLDRNRIKNK